MNATHEFISILLNDKKLIETDDHIQSTLPFYFYVGDIENCISFSILKLDN